MIKIYGIKNCDTMKKAFRWLEENSVAYEFHDYKKSGADIAVLERAIQIHGWENVINRKGASWRALSDALKNGMNAQKAIAAAIDNPSLIKRPLLLWGEEILLGFSPEEYADCLLRQDEGKSESESESGNGSTNVTPAASRAARSA
ncbi:MAG: ArsC family reductase [Alphaproteobacteria bacterium]